MRKLKKSIITNDYVTCYICGAHSAEIHHIYFGSGNRKISDNNGFIVPLCHQCHTGNTGVHFDRERDLQLKQDCQRAYERTHSREDFILLIGRNYLDGV